MKQMLGKMMWLPVVFLVLLMVYLPGLGNAIVFDDQGLTNGNLFQEFGSLLQLKPRMLSYGSFVWIQDWFGAGWWKQRLVNLLIHFGVILALWAFYREITPHVTPPAEDDGVASQRPGQPYQQSLALGFAIAVFALNPVAVYAVAYLIQRSILMATLFVVLGLWFFARGLATQRRGWLVAALVAYLLAVMSKEHAIMAPLAVVPVYILVARPSGRRLAAIAAIGGVLVAAMGLVLALKYGEIIGKPFDQFSKIYLAQLAALGPDVGKNAYALSIINQAWLFFKYGMHWLLPYAGWMSIDMRPPFPVSLFSFPHVLGVVGYLGLIGGGFVLVIRYRDWRALAGLSVLLPALLFATEFSTVWVQDPFVLYRSYLWAIGLPGLVLILLHGASARSLALLGVVVGGLFAWQGLDRVSSLATMESIWTDAIAKNSDDPRAVGRWFHYLSRGNIYLDAGRTREAAQDFKNSSLLGDRGMGLFNISAMLFLRKQYAPALSALDDARRMGYDFPGFHYQRGAILFELGRLDDARQELDLALAENPAPAQRAEALFLKGRTALGQGRQEDAIQDMEEVLRQVPDHKMARYHLGMTYVMAGRFAEARETLTRLLAEGAQSSVYYGRAMANYGLKNKAEALADIEAAIKLGPDNPNFREWLAKIKAMK